METRIFRFHTKLWGRTNQTIFLSSMPGLKWHLIMSSLTITLGNHVKNQSSQLPTRWLAVTVFSGGMVLHHEQQPNKAPLTASKEKKGCWQVSMSNHPVSNQKKTCQSHVSQGLNSLYWGWETSNL